MANGRSSVFRGAGIAAGKYKASQERSRGFEAQKAGAAALDSMNLQKMYETTGVIAEGIGLVSTTVDSAYSKKELGEAVEGMKATEKKQGFGDWLVSAEKEYEMTDASGEKITRKASELKTDWGTKKAEAAKDYDPKKAKVVKKDEKPTMLDEANQSKKPNWLSDDKGMIQGYTEDGKKKLRFGEEKGVDTKTTDWFQSLFKGGADKETTGDNVNNQSDPTQSAGTNLTKTQSLLEATTKKNLFSKEKPLIPEDSPVRKSLEGLANYEQEFIGPQMPSKGMMGSKTNPYLGMSFNQAYGAANKATGGQGTFWWQSEQGGSKEYGF